MVAHVIQPPLRDMSGIKRQASTLTHDSTSGGQAHPEKKKRDVNTIKSTTITTAGTGVVHPFFSSKPTPTLGHFQNSPATVVHFLHLDPFLSSSEGESSTTRKPIEIVFYDLDGTLIKTRANTSGFPKDRADWQWWDPSVPGRLKREWEQGKHLVVLSNQGHTSPKVKAEWRAKLPLIAAKMPADTPIRIIAALGKDQYRKPMTGMFDLVRNLYREKGYEVDMEKSVYVGDAAGRLAGPGRRRDHGDTDYKLALNAGLKFLTPEEHFLGLPRPEFPEPPNGFHPSKINLNLPHVVPSNTPIARKEVELVIFVGPPASGKTTFYRTHFHPRYRHINQDILKSRDKCLRVAEDTLTGPSPSSVVIDNTNRNRATRALYIALANKLNIPVRCFYFNTSVDLARHNNVYRACYGPPGEDERTLLPGSAFGMFMSAFERPEENEGFDELRTVNFVWEGTDEQRKLWERYMLEVK